MTWRSSKFVYPINALGEIICPGCGLHMRPPSHAKYPLLYCSGRCKQRARYDGGRYTRADLKEAIAAVIAGEPIPDRKRAFHRVQAL